MNLINRGIYDLAMPWGSGILNDFGNIGFDPNLVQVSLTEGIRLGHNNRTFEFPYWKDGWWQGFQSAYQIGMLVSKDEYRVHFGEYHFIIKLPNFRGSWPGIWLIDLHKAPPDGDGMGIPPEIDIMEHFRKDRFLTRFHTTHTFHQGPTYENNHENIKAKYSWCPVDKKPMLLTFVWNKDEMIWFVNDKQIMYLPSYTPNFPLKPMNLIMNSGIGPEWKPQVDKFEDFIISQANYIPK